MAASTKRSDGLRTYCLARDDGFELSLLNYGARIRALRIRRGSTRLDLALAYRRDADYLSDRYCTGAAIGRFCNRLHHGGFRIGHAQFPSTVNEETHQNTLHGGAEGFDARICAAPGTMTAASNSLCYHRTMIRVSPATSWYRYARACSTIIGCSSNSRHRATRIPS